MCPDIHVHGALVGLEKQRTPRKPNQMISTIRVMVNIETSFVIDIHVHGAVEKKPNQRYMPLK